MANDEDSGDAGSMEQQQQQAEQQQEEEEEEEEEDEEEDEEFLDGSHSHKNAAAPHLDHRRSSSHHHQDANRSDHLLSNPPAAPTAALLPTAAHSKELLHVEVELRLLEALEIYHPAKLQGMHRHFILYGLMEYLERRLNHHFTSNEILEFLDRFYNLELLKADEEESELRGQEEEFSLPASVLSIKELRENS